MGMMISWVATVNPSHPYFENAPARSFDSHHMRIPPWLQFRWSPVLPVRPRLTWPIARDKFSAERTGGEASCPLRAPQRPPTGCLAMPAQVRELLERPFILGTAGPDGLHCHHPKGSLAYTPRSSHRAASPQA